MKPTYLEQLKDPRWQKKRLEIMQRDAWACVFCGDKETTLSVHHFYYVSGGRPPWEYPNYSLATTCEECHKGQSLRATEEGPLEWEMIAEVGLSHGFQAGFDFAHDLSLQQFRLKLGDIEFAKLIVDLLKKHP